MNIGELVEKLSEYPKDTLVIVEGYEGGYNDINESDNDSTRKIDIYLDNPDGDMMGKYSDYYHGYDDYQAEEDKKYRELIKAVVIPR